MNDKNSDGRRDIEDYIVSKDAFLKYFKDNKHTQSLLLSASLVTATESRKVIK